MEEIFNLKRYGDYGWRWKYGDDPGYYHTDDDGEGVFYECPEKRLRGIMITGFSKFHACDSYDDMYRKLERYHDGEEEITFFTYDNCFADRFPVNYEELVDFLNDEAVRRGAFFEDDSYIADQIYEEFCRGDIGPEPIFEEDEDDDDDYYDEDDEEDEGDD